MAGYDQLALKNKEIMQELEPYYGLIGDVLDFKDHAFHLLNDLNSNVIQFKVCVLCLGCTHMRIIL